MNLTKPFNSRLGKWTIKAARPLGGVDSLNPCRWRGKRLHHHGGGVCWLFVLLWMDLWCHELNVCKKWYKNNLKMRLTALLSAPDWRAPYPLCIQNSFSLYISLIPPNFFLSLSLSIESPLGPTPLDGCCQSSFQLRNVFILHILAFLSSESAISAQKTSIFMRWRSSSVHNLPTDDHWSSLLCNFTCWYCP